MSTKKGEFIALKFFLSSYKVKEGFMRPVHKLRKKQKDMIAVELFFKVLLKPKKIKKRKIGVFNLVIWIDYNGAK